MEDPTGATETGCLGGYEVLSVAELAGLGFDRDGWASMTDANLDGTICGKALSERQQEKFCESVGGCGVPVIYGGRDNSVAGWWSGRGVR